MTRREIFFLPGLLLCFQCMLSQEKTALQFDLKFRDAALVSGQKYISKKQDTLQIDALRFYISDIEIGYADNSKLKSKASHFVDLDIRESQKIMLNADPKKIIDNIVFSIGVDSLSNVSGALAGDLDPAKGMYWAWQSGYINMKIEGKSASCKTRKNQFHFHIGGYLQPNNALRVVKIPTVSDKDIVLTVDVAALLDEVDLKNTNSIMIPGKHAMELADLSTKMFRVE